MAKKILPVTYNRTLKEGPSVWKKLNNDNKFRKSCKFCKQKFAKIGDVKMLKAIPLETVQ